MYLFVEYWLNVEYGWRIQSRVHWFFFQFHDVKEVMIIHKLI